MRLSSIFLPAGQREVWWGTLSGEKKMFVAMEAAPSHREHRCSLWSKAVPAMCAAAARLSRRWHCAPGSQAVALHRPRNQPCPPDLVGSSLHPSLLNLYRAESLERTKFKGQSAAMSYPWKSDAWGLRPGFLCLSQTWQRTLRCLSLG